MHLHAVQNFLVKIGVYVGCVWFGNKIILVISEISIKYETKVKSIWDGFRDKKFCVW